MCQGRWYLHTHTYIFVPLRIFSCCWLHRLKPFLWYAHDEAEQQRCRCNFNTSPPALVSVPASLKKEHYALNKASRQFLFFGGTMPLLMHLGVHVLQPVSHHLAFNTGSLHHKSQPEQLASMLQRTIPSLVFVWKIAATDVVPITKAPRLRHLSFVLLQMEVCADVKFGKLKLAAIKFMAYK